MQIPQIEPFQFIRSTAFSERVQLANKINEIIAGINQIGDIPDFQTQIDAINSEISEIQTSIGNTDTSLAELENKLNALISEVNTTIKQAISALESNVDGIDTRLTTAEGTISEHGTEIDGLLKEVIDGVVMTSSPHGTVQVQINHEDGSNDISAPIDLGLVEQGGIVLQSGTTDRSFKLIVTLTDGTSWQTNDFVIPEGGGTDVSVTNISIAQGTGTDKIQVKIGLSDGSTISSNDWTVVTPSEFSALGTRVTTAEGNITAQAGEISALGTRMTTAENNITKNTGDITKNTGDISNLETRVQAIEDSPGFTLQPATATTLGGVKIGANVKVQADGTISVDLSSYALKTEIPDVSGFITSEDVAAGYQPKGDYLTEVPVGGVVIGGVKNGGNVTIEADGTMNFVGGDGWEDLNLNSLPTDFAIGDELEIVFKISTSSLSTGGWDRKPSSIKIISNPGILRIARIKLSSNNDDYLFGVNIATLIYDYAIIIISLDAVYRINKLNDLSGNIFRLKASMFNASGNVTSSLDINRSNISTYVYSMKRKRATQ